MEFGNSGRMYVQRAMKRQVDVFLWDDLAVCSNDEKVPSFYVILKQLAISQGVGLSTLTLRFSAPSVGGSETSLRPLVCLGW